MARWEPDSRGRLLEAALELFAEHGYDNTTVAEIAERAGLTERTFFRHFADKREVLFAGGAVLEETLVEAVAAAPELLAPIDLAAAGLEAAGAMFPERSEFSKQRQMIINANGELRERELAKLASLAAALAQALRARGVEEATATLTAGVAMAVFSAAFAQWIAEAGDRSYPEVFRESMAEMKSLTAAGSPAAAA